MASCAVLSWGNHWLPLLWIGRGAKTKFTGQTPPRVLLVQEGLVSQLESPEIQDPLLTFSAKSYFLKPSPSFSLKLRFPLSLPKNLWEMFFCLRNVPFQEGNAHESNIHWSLSKCREGMAYWKEFLGCLDSGLNISVLSIDQFYNLDQSHLYSLSPNFLFCQMLVISPISINLS